MQHNIKNEQHYKLQKLCVTQSFHDSVSNLDGTLKKPTKDQGNRNYSSPLLGDNRLHHKLALAKARAIYEC